VTEWGNPGPVNHAKLDHDFPPVVLLAIRVPATNEREPDHVEQMLDALHARMGRGDEVTLSLARHDGRSGLFARCPPHLQPIVAAGIQAFYPDAEIETLDESSFGGSERTARASLCLRPDVFPLRRFSEMSSSESGILVDPLSGVLGACALAEQARVDLVLRKASRGCMLRAQKLVEVLHRPFFRRRPRLGRRLALLPRWLSLLLARIVPAGRFDSTHRELMTSPNREHEREGDIEAANDKLTAHPLFQAELRFAVTGTADGQLEEAEGTLLALMAAYAPFVRRRQVAWQIHRGRRKRFLLSTEETASLWHPPARQVQASQWSVSDFTQIEAPLDLPNPADDDVTLVGRCCFRDRNETFGLATRDRLRHLVLVGKTGTGKSTLLSNLLLSDMESGRGAALLDPHGDLADHVLSAVPTFRTRDVVLIDVGDEEQAVAFNVFDCPSRKLESLVASGIVEVFKKLNADLSWGPRLEDLLRNSARLLLEQPGTTLISLERLLSDERYRVQATRDIRDPTIRNYWQREVPSWSKNERTVAVAAVLNKVRPFLANPVLRNIVGQTRGKVNLREIMDDGRILIVNLSKSRIGDDGCALLGSLLLTSLQIAALSRGDAPPEQRPPFFAYVDEFQNFATRSFATVLSEARKYGFGLTLAHQYIDQLDDATRAAVFGNVDNLICFRVGNADAVTLAEEFGGRVPEQDFARLPRFTAYARLSVDGTPKGPFTITTLPPAQGREEDRSGVVRRTSNHRYARFVSEIQKEIEAAYA